MDKCMKISMRMGGRNPRDKALVSVIVLIQGSDIINNMANELHNVRMEKQFFQY